jgi:hypothetical protein
LSSGSHVPDQNLLHPSNGQDQILRVGRWTLIGRRRWDSIQSMPVAIEVTWKIILAAGRAPLCGMTDENGDFGDPHPRKLYVFEPDQAWRLIFHRLSLPTSLAGLWFGDPRSPPCTAIRGLERRELLFSDRIQNLGLSALLRGSHAPPQPAS